MSGSVANQASAIPASMVLCAGTPCPLRVLKTSQFGYRVAQYSAKNVTPIERTLSWAISMASLIFNMQLCILIAYTTLVARDAEGVEREIVTVVAQECVWEILR